MKLPCLRCKGKGFCGRLACPLIIKANALFRIKRYLKKDFFGSAPAPFIGHRNYPHLNVGILSLQTVTKDAWLYDAPRYWANQGFGIEQIVGYRSELVNSSIRLHVKDFNRALNVWQTIGMASKPVDVEISLKKRPSFRLSMDPYAAPTGPSARLKKARLTENPKIHRCVEKVVNDTDRKAYDALIYLYKHNFDENFLSKLLCIGSIGIAQKRRLVPTRWSITATDSMLGNFLLSKVKEFKECDFMAYFGGYLGNYYLILFFPAIWSYELFELYKPRTSWNVSGLTDFTTDFEPYFGRKSYAENCAGGFYTARLAVLEKLNKLKRQAAVLAIRIITGEYAVPLGVWVTREAARKALKNKNLAFDSAEQMLTYAKELVRKRFGIDITNILNQSILLRNFKNQRKLTQFF